MKTLKSCRALARRLFIAGAAGVVLALTGCASIGDALFSDSSSAQPPPLLAPSPVFAGFYRVNPGDTITTVAIAFGRKPAEVAAWNQLSVDRPLGIGQLLRVAPWPGDSTSNAQTGATAIPAAQQRPVEARQPRFVWPVSGAVVAPFGADDSNGIRLASAPNEAVKAADAGRVIYAGSQLKAYGQIVIVKHNGGFVSAYGNNAKILVKEGDVVRQGQPIAQMGADSEASRTLIFELREGGKAVDPQRFLPKRAG